LQTWDLTGIREIKLTTETWRRLSPIKALAGARRIFEPREQNAARLDPAAIQKLASQMSGHVITQEAPDYESARRVSTALSLGVRR
jgi:hypothetical protein